MNKETKLNKKIKINKKTKRKSRKSMVQIDGSKKAG